MTLKSRCALLLALLIIIACPLWAPADDDHAAAKAAAVEAAQDFLQLQYFFFRSQFLHSMIC